MANEELLGRLDQAFSDLRGSYQGLSEEQLSQPTLDQWSVNDLLSHLAGWHEEMARMFDRMLRGERPTPEGADYSDPDAWNARFVEERRGRSWIEVTEDLATSYRELRARAESMPPDRLVPGKTAYRLIVDDTIGHYREHGDQIGQWRRSAGW